MAALTNIIEKIEKAGIIGRGGAEYPAHLKWRAVRDEQETPKYVVCNVSEREPGVFKDYHILAHNLETVMAGVKLAMDTVGTKKAYINLNAVYEKKFRKSLDAALSTAKKAGYEIRIFEEAPSYIGGEETALLNAIEGKRCEPRSKPPFPTESGLYGKPTLIHNVETLYDIALVAQGAYEGKRFFSVSGAVDNIGVFHLPAGLTVREVLHRTKNEPKEAYFVQVGGGASGTVINQKQTETEKVHGAGALTVHLLSEDPRALVLNWLKYYHTESCGKCTPCREGTFQLVRMAEESKEIPWKKMQPIFDVLEKTAFCALGRGVPVPLLSYYKNVLPLL